MTIITSLSQFLLVIISGGGVIASTTEDENYGVEVKVKANGRAYVPNASSSVHTTYDEATKTCRVSMGATGYSNDTDIELEEIKDQLLTQQHKCHIFNATLTAGETSLVITHDVINSDSLVDVYVDKYGVTPYDINQYGTNLALDFYPQEADLHVKVVIR